MGGGGTNHAHHGHEMGLYLLLRVSATEETNAASPWQWISKLHQIVLPKPSLSQGNPTTPYEAPLGLTRADYCIYICM